MVAFEFHCLLRTPVRAVHDMLLPENAVHASEPPLSFQNAERRNRGCVVCSGILFPL
jgi:hypothetical protein